MLKDYEIKEISDTRSAYRKEPGSYGSHIKRSRIVLKMVIVGIPVDVVVASWPSAIPLGIRNS